jgi:hypothetical protein
MRDNPYIGPRPYGRGEGNFFGREREGKELAWLILAEQAVLFYAQSGAGKTSLLNARVIPILEKKGVLVLPVARVGSGLPALIESGQVENIFVFSDRPVDPILESNRAWELTQEQKHPWRPVARQGQAAHSDTLLYRGKELQEAQAWLDTAMPM